MPNLAQTYAPPVLTLSNTEPVMTLDGTWPQVIIAKPLDPALFVTLTPMFVGPAGPAGAGGSSFNFVQASASSVWTINHNLNTYPVVSVIDSANSVMYGDVNYPSLNTAVVTFSAAFAGKAHLI